MGKKDGGELDEGLVARKRGPTRRTEDHVIPTYLFIALWKRKAGPEEKAETK